jgi:hypothetical protein
MRQVPPAYSQSHQDIDTADLASYWDRSFSLSPPESPQGKFYFEYRDEPSPSGRKKPEQSNSSALEAAEDVDYPSSDRSAPYPDAYKGPGNYSVEQRSPAKMPMMRNVKSEQLETGSYDTTRSTYFYSDTSHLDTRRRDQTPTTRRPELPLSPTTMTAQPQQLHTRASKDAQEPATEPAQTPHEAQEDRHNQTLLRNARVSERFRLRRIEREEAAARTNAELNTNEILPSLWAPQSQDTTPQADTPPLPYAAQPTSWPYQNNRSLSLAFDSDHHPPTPFSIILNNAKQTEYSNSEKRPPVPLFASSRETMPSLPLPQTETSPITQNPTTPPVTRKMNQRRRKQPFPPSPPSSTITKTEKNEKLEDYDSLPPSSSSFPLFLPPQR